MAEGEAIGVLGYNTPDVFPVPESITDEEAIRYSTFVRAFKTIGFYLSKINPESKEGIKTSISIRLGMDHFEFTGLYSNNLTCLLGFNSYLVAKNN